MRLLLRIEKPFGTIYPPANDFTKLMLMLFRTPELVFENTVGRIAADILDLNAFGVVHRHHQSKILAN